jgi:hypothetical protein
MERLVASHALSTKPRNQAIKDTVSAIIMVMGFSREIIALECEWATLLDVPRTEHIHNFSV